MFAKQPCFAGNFFAILKAQHERGAGGRYLHILRPHFAAFPAHQTLGLFRLFIQPCHDAVIVQKHGIAVFRQCFNQFILGFFNTLNGAEGVQMLGPHRRQNADFRVHQIAKLLDFPHMAGAHFANEHLMGGLQPLPDDPGHTHGGIEGGRRAQHIILLRKNGVQHKFGAGFAVAAGNADADEPLVLKQLLFRILKIHPENHLLDGQSQHGRQRHHQGQQQWI